MYGKEDASWLNELTLSGTLSKPPPELSTVELQKYKVILEMTSRVMRENPGFHLYIVGHSLGGALATLFALQAAAAPDSEIPKPVTCITTGAPKVGNLDFLKSFEVSSNDPAVGAT